MYLFAFFNVIFIAYHVYAIDAYNKSIIIVGKSYLFWICDVLLSKWYYRIHRMPNKCAALGCSTRYDTDGDQKITTFHFPHTRKDLHEIWIKFVNRGPSTNWGPSTNIYLCKKHFQEQYMYFQVEMESCSYNSQQNCQKTSFAAKYHTSFPDLQKYAILNLTRCLNSTTCDLWQRWRTWWSSEKSSETIIQVSSYRKQ